MASVTFPDLLATIPRVRFTALPLLLGVLLLGACVTDRPHSPAVTRLSKGICTTETPLGSHRPKRVCRSNEEMEADRKAAQNLLNAIRNTPKMVPRQ
jgi:hypothetical protein